MEHQTELFAREKTESYDTKSALIPPSGTRKSWKAVRVNVGSQKPKEDPTKLLKEIIESQDGAVCDMRNWKADGPTDASILNRYAKAGSEQNDYPNVSGSRLFGLILPELKKANIPAETVLEAFQKALLRMKKHIQYAEKCMMTSLSCYYHRADKTLWLGHFKSEYKTYLVTCKFAGYAPKSLRRCHLSAVDNAIAVLKLRPQWLKDYTLQAKTEKQKQAATAKHQKEITDINSSRERLEKIREALFRRLEQKEKQ